MSKLIRQIHRWVSIVFTVTVIANFIALSGGGTPPPWITYSPLLPLAFLLFSGLLCSNGFLSLFWSYMPMPNITA